MKSTSDNTQNITKLAYLFRVKWVVLSHNLTRYTFSEETLCYRHVKNTGWVQTKAIEQIWVTLRRLIFFPIMQTFVIEEPHHRIFVNWYHICYLCVRLSTFIVTIAKWTQIRNIYFRKTKRHWDQTQLRFNNRLFRHHCNSVERL